MPPRLLACTPGEDGVPFSRTVAGTGLGVGGEQEFALGCGECDLLDTQEVMWYSSKILESGV